MIINDPLHGAIKIGEMEEWLVKTPEFQRLKWVRQLGLALVAFPGANHTRFEHSLGCYHLAKRILDQLDLESPETLAAALLHDIGHGPFSHVTEPYTGDHVEIGKEIILGKRGEGHVRDVLEEFGIEPKKVVDILDEKAGIYSQIISSAIDADRLDYLKRDAFFTGVSYGNINHERLITLMDIEGGKIVFDEKAIDAIEDFFVARMHMYRTVYYHHTKRIADLMLREAIKESGISNFWFMTDGELLETLKKEAKEWVDALIYRRLFKRAIELREVKKEIEEEVLRETIAEKAGIKKKDIIVYVPKKKKTLKKRSVFIKGGHDVLEHSPLLKTLSRIYQTPISLGIYTKEKYREKVRAAAIEVLKNEGAIV